MRSSILSGVRAGSLVLLLALSLPARCDVVVASEFFHEGMGHYFVTAFAGEEAALDAHPSWARTATQYRVHDAPGPGLVPVCRFFSASFAPLSSHFYTADAVECEIVKRNPSWTYEGIAFFVQPAAADGACAAGWGPVYRLYNDGRTGAPNHRYTPRRLERAAFQARGWLAEGAGPLGVAFCVPVTTDEGADQLRQLANGAWSFLWSGESVTTIVTVQFGNVRPSIDPDFTFEVRDVSGLLSVHWDSYVARFVLAGDDVDPVRFAFDLTPEGRIVGCVYESAVTGVVFPPGPYEQVTYEPCRDLVGSRSE